MTSPRDAADPVRRLSAVDTGRLPADGGPDFNRLIFAKSPYLLQHAANPVDWHPWGEDAFARARAEDKPVFLSIGYSTCHWCHVMAHESFEDEEVAACLRRGFIAIKVDREERPDVDATYMAACQLFTGSGGWPLTVVMTPEKEPFFAATYLPRRSRQGMIGLVELLERIAGLWAEERERLITSGRQLASALADREEPPGDPARITPAPLTEALSQYRKHFDQTHGGFGGAPKFPAPHNLSLLLRLGQRFRVPEATAMALQTLQALRLGGIYDQIGFGLHRYAVDERWQVPHFEKMLYDQALLILAATEAFQVGGDRFHAQLAAETCEYVLRDLQGPEGGLFCGEDADSEGEEGRFYLWTPAEVEEVLGQELATVFCRSFGITGAGNFEGRSIPHLSEDVAALADRAGVPAGELKTALAEARRQLFAAREERPRPHRDDKVLTAWNGLAVAALARAGAALGRTDLVAAAGRTARFIGGRLRTADGRLLRRWREGEAAIPGFLEDYSFLAWGLLELYQARLDGADLDLALALTGDMERLFGDGADGLYDTGVDAEQVLGRGRSLQDGALPSGTSVAIGNLLRLGRLTGDSDLEERGRRLLARNLAAIERYPMAYAQALCGLDYALGPQGELTLPDHSPGTPPADLLAAARRGFHPRLQLKTAGSRTAPAGAMLCVEHTCLPPVTDETALAELLETRLSPPGP